MQGSDLSTSLAGRPVRQASAELTPADRAATLGRRFGRDQRVRTTRRAPGLSELAALAIGLLIGLGAGVTLLSVFHSRPRPAREIRLTITPNALPARRASTLAVDRARPGADLPGRGGPADPAILAASRPNDRPARTLVPAGADGGALVAFPIARRIEPEPILAGQADRVADEPVTSPVAVANPAGASPVALAPVAAAVAVAVAERPDSGSTAIVPAGHAGPDDPLDEPVAGSAEPGPVAQPGPGPSDRAAATGASQIAPSGPCAEERRVAGERCDLADRLREQANAASQSLREQQRAYDALAARAAEAAGSIDARQIQAAKEAARQAFRRAHAAARSRDDLEAAATDWLGEINRVNQAARDGAAEAIRTRDASAALALTIERLSLEADVARINAESAAEACHAAREVLAACEEAQVDRRAGRVPVATAAEAPPAAAIRPRLVGGPELEPGEADEIIAPAARAFAGAEPRVLRMLRGDGGAIRAVVREVAADDPAEQRRWQLLLSGLVDACVARAIEASTLEFPLDHPFWGPFSQAQNRDIATALASLGYRFDGLGGFADGRVPSQRDLSLALGYAGLDPMRLRTWPNEAAMPRLFADVRVAADELVAAAAPDLSLGEMVALLGGRAEPLADLWNNWGKVRPALLEA